jgi:large conductance mechanosensitive channel
VLLKEFKEFLLKQNALALAIGVIIGAAIGKVVSSLADNVINPIIGELLPGGDWRSASIVLSRGVDATGKETVNAISYGTLIGALVDFVIIAFVVFMLARAFIPKDKEKEPETKECPQCLQIIPIAAKRCKACTQPVG